MKSFAGQLLRQHEPDDPVRLRRASGSVVARREESAVWCATCGVISGSDARRGNFPGHHLVHPRADITDLGMPERKVSYCRKGCSLVAGEMFQSESATERGTVRQFRQCSMSSVAAGDFENPARFHVIEMCCRQPASRCATQVDKRVIVLDGDGG